MVGLSTLISLSVLALWIITLSLPWLPWRVREVLDADQSRSELSDLSDISVVIPARNEEEIIAKTLAALQEQGSGLKIILVDDESEDSTAEIAQSLQLADFQIISSKPLPAGWTGKLWAQQQGLDAVQTPLTLLLDADIQLTPGIIAALKSKQQSEQLQFVSLMAQLRLDSFWERLLMPAFIYFFKMLYPFALANKPGHWVAAAAGGCILVETDCLRQINAMESIKNAVIDDCTLAKQVKSAGYKTWVGLTHSVISQRPYQSLTEIWDMVARTAYSQLFYSVALLLLCTAVMFLMYIWPVLTLLYSGAQALYGVLSLTIMMAIYVPTLRFYSLHWIWVLSLPVISGLYLLMTWTSAIRYWRGERSRWKGRVYQTT